MGVCQGETCTIMTDEHLEASDKHCRCLPTMFLLLGLSPCSIFVTEAWVPRVHDAIRKPATAPYRMDTACKRICFLLFGCSAFFTFQHQQRAPSKIVKA